MNVPFELVVAMDTESGIGKDGGLPWHLPADLKHFKEITCEATASDKKNVVIMGRKTWESLPPKFRPLPERINIVLTRRSDFILPEEVYDARALSVALNLIQNGPLSGKVGKIFVIGGGQVFRSALQLPECRKIHLTRIFKNFECDTFFPDFSASFKPSDVSERFCDIPSGTEYSFTTYTRI